MAVKSFASEMNGYSNPHFDHKDENIADIQSKVNRLEIVVNALWEVLKENDIGEDILPPGDKKESSFRPPLNKQKGGGGGSCEM